jgi:anti-sigma regulatory factor (Ser/Thr protein kinase)
MVYPPGLLVEEGGEPRRLAVTGNGFLAGSAGAAGGPSPAGTRTLILDRQFDADTLYTLRAAVQDHALQVGLTEDLTGDLVLAAHELAANAVAHGAGYGRLRLWYLPDALTCEIIDDGLAAKGVPDASDPAPGGSSGPRESRDSGWPGSRAGWPVVEGHGLWLAQLVATQLDVWSGHRGSRAVVTFRLSGPD